MNADPLSNAAMILAAGLGTRMRPLTDSRPKPLVEVAGRTLIDYNLAKLAGAGIRRAVVNVHYFADMLEAHVRTWREPVVVVSDERDRILNSGGGVKKALALLGQGPFFSLNADTIWLDGPVSNLKRMAAAFDPYRMDILLLLAPTVSTIGWGNRGDFVMDQAGRIRWPAPGEVAPFAYCGAAILQPQLFADTPEEFSLVTLFRRAAERDRLFGLRLDGVFMHVGTPEAVIEAERALSESQL
ncbi:MAG TPA: nucleotidyltransferase family protein [Beijerinckiaceae bacterium]|nr:nucleotidyltransferase family protein [Beijerinckiaceae bacterium]